MANENFPTNINPNTSANSTGGDGFRFNRNTQDNSTAPILLGIGGALLFTSLFLLAARLWSRVRPVSRLHWDDWTIIVSTILAIANYVLLAVAVLNGLGRRAIFVSFRNRRIALQLIFTAQIVWYWAVTFVKLSVACFLLRLKYHSRPWRIVLYALMIFLVLAACLQTIFTFTQCRPFSIFWDPRVLSKGPAQCFSKAVIDANIVFFSSVQVGVDLLFSFIPISFIWKLNRPRRERVFLSVMMALGLFASAAAIMRTLQLQDFYANSDLFRVSVTIALWATVEVQFALIAATIPTLKAFLENALVRLGLFFYDANSETQVRGRLVKLGLLDLEQEQEGEAWPAQIPSKPKKVRDEYGDTIVDTMGDKEVERDLYKLAV